MKEKKGKPLHGVFSNIAYAAKDMWQLDKAIIIFVLLQNCRGENSGLYFPPSVKLPLLR